MKNKISLLAAACAAVLVSSPAHAGRPLQTEDAGVLDRGDCELEGATQRLSAFGEHATDTGLQIGCGIGWDSQTALGASTARAAGERTRGLTLGGKTGLWQAYGKDEAAALTLAWALASEKAPGNSWRHAGSELNLVFSTPLAADLTLHTNLGHARDEQAKQRATTWGVAIEHAGCGADSRWAPMAELFGDDRDKPFWNLGLGYTALPEKLFIDASYGRQLASGRPALATLGFKFVF